jgi:ubiquinone/menaquinone biosynthesis C-methylase UbiE
MVIKDPGAIKKIVQKNFDNSADLYDSFEERYGLFRHLTYELAKASKIQTGWNVYDIGCGTGASSFVLKNFVGSNGYVIGVDFSEEMLHIAQERQKTRGIENLDFTVSDADDFALSSNRNINSILYNASIFLIPEPKQTLLRAYNLLKDKSTIGMNYLIGVYETDAEPDGEVQELNNDLFQLASASGKPFAPYGRNIMDFNALPELLKEIGFRRIRTGILTVELSEDEMRAFYSIPAQSAALWPKNDYEERLKFLDLFMEYLKENNISNFYQYWGWCVGEK